MFPVALVTVPQRGIALELAALGTHDLVIDYAGNEEAARERQRINRQAFGERRDRRAGIVQGDISLVADRERIIGLVESEFGQLALLVNNAGIAPEVRAHILEASGASFDRLIGVNLKGPYFLTQRAAGPNGRRGSSTDRRCYNPTPPATSRS